MKIDKFDARDIGQLGTYVTVVNHILRDPEKDNPTIAEIEGVVNDTKIDF